MAIIEFARNKLKLKMLLQVNLKKGIVGLMNKDGKKFKGG